ncbi:MAG: RidA family protein [Anaerolineaceae bacterium]|nr:RidA family protein [Anaerolineaceae bacterium]
MKTFRYPETIHSPLAAYAHQVEISGAQRWLLLSGQVGMQPDGVLPDDPAAQFEAALDNVHQNLQAAGMEMQDIVKLTLFLVEPIDPGRRGEILSARLPGHRPCMTLLYVAALANPRIKVEIEAMACADAL